LFATGAVMTIGALAWLGRSFGVMPAQRQTVIGGPYRFVRHPAYAGEMLVMLACFLAGPSPAAASVWLLLIPGIAWRILAEEAVLAADAGYEAYRRQVRWRLIPGIW